MHIPMKITVIDEALTPKYAHEGDAGMDLRARIAHPINLQKGHRVTIPTGVFIEIPQNFVGLLCPRSGLAAKYGVTVTNSPGIIDHGFTGEVCVILQKTTDEPLTINYADRIAQLVITPCVTAQLVVVESLGATARGTDGFGSSGVA